MRGQHRPVEPDSESDRLNYCQPSTTQFSVSQAIDCPVTAQKQPLAPMYTDRLKSPPRAAGREIVLLI